MKATETNFLKFLQGTKQFIIPIYQRTYSWRLSDCQQFWNDILRVAQDEQIPAHFLGSVVYVGKDIYHVSSITQMLVIDGQQRLTTLFLLLAALGEALEAQGAEQGSTITRRKICNYYLFNADENDQAHYKLLLTQNDKNTLISILEGSEKPENVSLRLKENYQFFKDQISQSQISLSTLYEGISKLIIVDISLEQKDNPQLIFESLNSTGMDLSQADLIRNYVLMGLDNDEQIKLYKKYWYPMEQSFGQTQNVALFNRFMRDYLTIHMGDIPNMDKVYATFKVYHQNKTHVPMEEVVADIYRYSKHFTCMLLAREKDAEIKHCFDDIKTLEVNVVYPFLLEVYEDYEQQRLSRADFIKILKLIESYVFRRLICGIPTHGLNKVFATLTKEIDKEHYLESVQAIFLQRGAGARLPRDEEFQTSFIVKDIYNSPSRIRHYLLSKLENHKRKERVIIEEYTIEHILPQNPNLSAEWRDALGPNWQEVQGKYLHTIGNLTLTAYNAEMSDRPFREKRDKAETGLAYSPLHLNTGLGQVECWDAKAVEQRAQRLAERALQIWALPALTAEEINRYGQRTQKAPLVEIIGPIEHPLAGFVPVGYKIVPLNEKRFNYYGLVSGEWVPYGNGKVAWYAISWKSVGKNIRDLAKKNEKPLGIGGEIDPRYAKVTNGDTLAQDQNGDDADEQTVYTLDHYVYLQGSTRTLFESLRKRILNLDPLVREEYKKLYIAYKTATNFVDIEPHKSYLKLYLNMSFSEIDDPKNLCRDITAVGHHGNGDIEVRLSSLDQLDDVMDLIRQAFEERWEEGVA
jgi:uncharacterized protein with ParB-like and HNH nuclease domain/predicted transport protein